MPGVSELPNLSHPTSKGFISVFQQRKIWQTEMFSVARQRIKVSSHSHFNRFFFYGLSPQSMLLITAELLNPLYLAANKMVSGIMLIKITFLVRKVIP